MEPVDHGIGRSRGGLTSKIHLAVDGNGRPLSVLITPGNINDTTMMTTVLDQIRVRRAGAGRPRTRPERVLADRGYPSRANRVWLARRGIKVTIPDRADQHTHRARRRARAGRPPAFDPTIYRRRNVVERGINQLKNWRGIAMRSDKTARNYHTAICLAATLIWLRNDLINTP